MGALGVVGLIILIALVLGAVVVIPRAIRIVQQYEMGIVFRFGKVLPYVSYAKTKDSGDPSFVYVSQNQDTKAIGVRWDFLRKADIKFQFERVDPKGTAGISFVNGTQAFGNSTISVTTLLVDFVF